MMQTIQQRLQRLRPVEWFMVAIVVIAAGLRLWNFNNTLQFLGDQGRDATVVSRIFKERDIILIGPVTSTGNMYLGPLYYYFMLPFLLATYPSPVGPAYAVAFLSIITVALMYWFGKQMVGEKAAVFATVLFTFSSTVVLFSRFSWNPNPAPLFGLLLLWCIYQTEKGKHWFWVGVSICIAVLTQLHYVTLLTLPVAGLFWLKQILGFRSLKKNAQQQLLLATAISIAVYCAFLLPLVVFDIRHNWLNVSSLQNFLETSQDSVSVMPWHEKLIATVAETHGRSLQLFFEVTIGKHRTLNTALLLFTVAMMIFFIKWKKNPHLLGHQILAVMYVVCVCGLAAYRSSVFDHYISFFFPATFLILGSILSRLSDWKPGWIVVGVFIVGYLGYNIPRMPLHTLGWTVDEMKAVSQTITDRVKPGEKYNIVLLSETKDIYGENYRYFLNTTENPPLRLEHFGEVETLFIIDEQKVEKDVTNLPIYEIVVFPNKTPTEVYSIPDGPQVTVLRAKHE